MKSLLLALLIACGGAGTTVDVEVAPAPMAGEDCGVCSMIVAEQPAPRGQALHRDGTHVHACALGDLRAHLEAPSAHGAALAVWVEALPADFDPSAPAGGPLPWIEAKTAWYVVGFQRPGTMGRPTLSFATEAEAVGAAGRLGAHVVRWPALRQTPSHQTPAAGGSH